MPHIDSAGVKIYYEEVGKGTPIIFVHEFSADYRTWEPQLRYFGRYYRCITFAMRGYPPSDIPPLPEYGYDKFADDIAAIITGLNLGQAYVVGLSMGGFSTLFFAQRHPHLAKGIVIGGVGHGSPPAEHKSFNEASTKNADLVVKLGWEPLAIRQAHHSNRRRLYMKDPRAWNEMFEREKEHSPQGMERIWRKYAAERPSIESFEKDWAKLQVPVMMMLGDEDVVCLETNLFLKRTLPNAGIWMWPLTGHGLNVEEPAAYNNALEHFFYSVEHGRWVGPKPIPMSDDDKKRAAPDARTAPDGFREQVR